MIEPMITIFAQMIGLKIFLFKNVFSILFRVFTGSEIVFCGGGRTQPSTPSPALTINAK